MRGFPLAGLPQLISLGSRSGMLEIIRREAVHRIIFTGGTITGLTSDGWTVAQELRDAPLLPPEVMTQLLAVNASFQELRAAIVTGGHMTADERIASETIPSCRRRFARKRCSAPTVDRPTLLRRTSQARQVYVQ